MQQILDSVIVGAGIAGLSAALFLGRAKRAVRVYDGGLSRNFTYETVREYLGFDGVTPTALLAQARTEVLRYGVDIRQEVVQHITPRPDGLFDVAGAEGEIVTARTVVLATGLVDELPPLTGLPPAWGRDVRVCPCFDGYEVFDEPFVVFGLPERLAHMASWVSMWSSDVTVVTEHHFNEADAERLALLDIQVVADEVTGLVHEADKLVGVATKNGRQIGCAATWIAMNSRAASGLAAALCDVDEFGFAKTDKGGRTSQPGVFAIGNANDAWAHLAHASAAGTTVGPLVTMYLLEMRLATRRTQKQTNEVLG